ncbi:MAG: MARVEL domain-containing protein [Bacteroidia bacterium]|nr:MARVEL domain-containing protein [Bacteroidia bacterium]
MAQQHTLHSKTEFYPEKKYYFSGKNLVIIAILTAFFFLISVYAFSKSLTKISFPTFLWALSAIAMLLMFYISVFLPYQKIRKGEPALILTNTILIDNINFRRIKWREVKSIQKGTGLEKDQGYIIIEIKNSEAVMRIPPNYVKVKEEELLKELQNYHQNCGG